MRDLISVDEALTLIRANAPVRAPETLSLDQCHGRTLAAPLIARVARPPAAVSAMDGYAVRLEDVGEAGALLTLIGEAPAGRPFDTPVKSGEAVRIFTGGELPPCTNHIIPQERAQRQGPLVKIENAYATSAFVRAAGMDFQNGATLLPAGIRIGPAELAIAAAANHGTLRVFKRTKVALLANGDELKPPGSVLERGQIVNSNPAALSALITQWGGEPVDLGIASDSIASIQSFIEGAQDADIIVPVGGASVGEHDHMPAAFAGLGYAPIFQKIAVQPGKPTWFSAKGGQLVLGLPGNPASALVCAHLFLAPLIDPARGHKLQSASLGAALPANGDRTNYLRAHITLTPEGKLTAVAAANQDSSLLTPFHRANGLIHRQKNAPALGPGASIKVLMIGPLSDG